MYVGLFRFFGIVDKILQYCQMGVVNDSSHGCSRRGILQLYILYVKRSTIGLLSDSCASCSIVS